MSGAWMWLGFALGWAAGFGGAWVAGWLSPKVERCARCGCVIGPAAVGDLCDDCWRGRGP